MTRQSIHLVSPPFASGQMWLTNALLALGVLVYGEDPASIRMGIKPMDNWIPIEGNKYRFKPEVLPGALTMMPLLASCIEFSLAPEVQVGVSHRVDLIAEKDSRVILMMRDGRDAIYSQFHRQSPYGFGDRSKSETAAFEEYLQCRLEDFSESTINVPLPMGPVGLWATFAILWNYTRRVRDICFVRFEDCKLHPQETLQRVVGYLGIQRDSDAIAKAVEVSKIERFQKVDEEKIRGEYAALLGTRTVNARRGKVEEWRERRWEFEASYYQGMVRDLLSDMGYDCTEISNDNRLFGLRPDIVRGQEKLRRWISLERSLLTGEQLLRPHTPNIERIACMVCCSIFKTGPTSSTEALEIFDLITELMHSMPQLLHPSIDGFVQKYLPRLGDLAGPELDMLRRVVDA